MVIEEQNARFLIDPGSYSVQTDQVHTIDAILITHEHQDHLDMNLLAAILKDNPAAFIYTNKGVGKKLSERGIQFTLLEHGQKAAIKGVMVEGFGTTHHLVYQGFPQADNVGYMIANRFFYPGDALTDPGKKVEILAAPIAGPWLLMADGIDYVKKLKPVHAFNVHDGSLLSHTSHSRWFGDILKLEGINFFTTEVGVSFEV